jgi:hypothetical protein
MTNTAVVAYESASLDARMKYANTIAAAGQMIPRGLFDNATGKPSPPKVLLVMETGAMLGLHPMAALQSINVVEGRATLSAQLIAALIRKAGNKLEIIRTGSVPTGDYSVTVIGTITDTGEKFDATWDIPRAIRAGLVDSYKPNAAGVWEVRARSDKGNPKPWEAYAEVMPVWRAISEVSRLGFSDVTFGMYSTEELTDGGLPLAEPDPEPTEDWQSLIAAATTRAELDEIAARISAKEEGTDKIRTAWLARAGVLAREEANTEDADVVNDDTETPAEGEDASPSASPTSSSAGIPEPTQEEYEAAEAARFDAEMAAGKVTRGD